MKSRIALLILVLLGGTGAYCTPAPPTLTPQAVTAFNLTRIEKSLDVIRDTAQDASQTVPPVIPVADAVLVTKAHKALVLVLEAQGTKAQITVGLDQLLADVSPASRALLGPYVALSKIIVGEVLP